MCEVATALAVGTAIVGSAMQMQGQQQQRRAQQREADTMAAAARAREERAAGAVDAAIPTVSREQADQTMAEGRAQRVQDFERATPQQTEYLPGASAGPQIVRTAMDRARAGTAAENAGRVDALARLGSWTDALRGIRTSIGRAGEEGTFQGLYSRGEAQTGARRYAGAANAGEGWRTAGNVVSAVGPVAATYGASGLSGLFRPATVAPKNKPAPL